MPNCQRRLSGRAFCKIGSPSGWNRSGPSRTNIYLQASSQVKRKPRVDERGGWARGWGVGRVRIVQLCAAKYRKMLGADADIKIKLVQTKKKQQQQHIRKRVCMEASRHQAPFRV